MILGNISILLDNQHGFESEWVLIRDISFSKEQFNCMTNSMWNLILFFVPEEK